MPLLHEDVTEGILKAFFGVYNELGYGFAEKVYENSMVIELKALGFSVEAQVPVKVYFKGQAVGDYIADLIENGCVIVELKAAETLVTAHATQIQNYLKATGLTVGMLLNFGKKPQFERKVFELARTYPR